jgi:cytochrome c heme-lyase
VSSIPRGSVAGASAEEDPGLLKTGVADSLPRHQAGTTGEDHSRWVYPSEQQLYNAMRRKGWSNVPETSIPVVLQIHNAVNETTWSRLLEYHQFTHFHPRLVRFQGRPTDVSPKAWFLANVLGYPKPFDRHDWLVEYYKPPVFGDGQGRWIEQRYVIDFYENHRQDRNAQNSSSPTRVDVRPALDSPRALWLIAKRGLQMALPGITNYWYRHRRSKGHPCEGDGTKSFEHERSP